MMHKGNKMKNLIIINKCIIKIDGLLGVCPKDGGILFMYSHCNIFIPIGSDKNIFNAMIQITKLLEKIIQKKMEHIEL